VESAAFAGKTVNDDRHAHGMRSLERGVFFAEWPGRGQQRKRVLAGLRIVEGGDFHRFLRDACWGRVRALKIPSLLEDLFEGFLTVEIVTQESLSHEDN